MATELREYIPTDEEKREAARQLAEALRPRPPAESIGVNEALADAVKQLGQSERGQQAMRDFLALLDNGGCGLDGNNWRALGTLVRVASVGYCGRLFDALDEALHPESEACG
jgi:hypothetical protein